MGHSDYMQWKEAFHITGTTSGCALLFPDDYALAKVPFSSSHSILAQCQMAAVQPVSLLHFPVAICLMKVLCASLQILCVVCIQWLLLPVCLAGLWCGKEAVMWYKWGVGGGPSTTLN